MEYFFFNVIHLLVSNRDHTHGLSFIFQVKQYRITLIPAYPFQHGSSPMLEGMQNASMKFDRDLSYNPTQSKLDLELAMIKSLSAQEAATYSAHLLKWKPI